MKVKAMPISMDRLESICGDNHSNPFIIEGNCHACGVSIRVEIHKTSAGFGLNHGALYVTTDGKLLVRCLPCHKSMNESCV
jgi:hypothetical protein